MIPKEVPKRIAVLAIRAYRLVLGPYLGRQCRFYPSCSQYAIEAVEQHGSLRGAGLALRRLSRCHPFHAGGIDLVPVPGGADAADHGIAAVSRQKES